MKYMIVLCLSFILFSCLKESKKVENVLTANSNSIERQLEIDLERLFPDHNKNALLIIPISGCSSCVRETLSFLNANYHKIDSKKNNIIFTELMDDHKFNLAKLSPNFLNGFFIDSTNELSNYFGNDNRVPLLVLYRNESISKVHNLTTDEVPMLSILLTE